VGLHVTHGCWGGPYSAFQRWRHGVAIAAGYAVWKVDCDGFLSPTVMLDWGHIDETNLEGIWPEDDPRVAADPLIVLLAHCDDRGVIAPVHAGKLADRIEAVMKAAKLEQVARLVIRAYSVATSPPHDEVNDHVAFLKAKTECFVTGLRLAAERAETVRFS
jgi:hypothetical protein